MQPPLATNYFSTFAKLVISADFEVKIDNIVNYIRSTRGIEPQAQPMDFDESIENVFAEVDRKLRRRFDSAPGRSSRPEAVVRGFALVKTYDQFVFWFAHVLNEIQNGRPCRIYQRLIRVAGPGSTFITFNWDTILDRALSATGEWYPDDGYGVSFDGLLDGEWRRPRRTHSRYRLLKLHGSTNWLGPYVSRHLQTGKRMWLATPNSVYRSWCLVDGSNRFASYKDRWRPGYGAYSYFFPPNDPIADHPLMPILIPPTDRKNFGEYRNIFDPVWKGAMETLNSADRIVMIGYSLPPTDKHALQLLTAFIADGRQKTIEVVNPHPEEVAERVRRRVKSRATVITRAMTLSQYLGLRDTSRSGTSEYELLFKRVPREARSGRKGARLAHMVQTLVNCNLSGQLFDLTTYDGKRYLDCTLPGEFATHLHGAYRAEVREYRLSKIPIKPLGSAQLEVALDTIWIVFPIGATPITEEAMQTVDMNQANEALTEMIRKSYHCVDATETERFVRRFLAV